MSHVANHPDLVNELEAYGFDLPSDLIAQEPSPRREEARLLVVRRSPSNGMPRFEDLQISDLPELCRNEAALKNALWVRNVSRVFPARIYARRASGGEHEIVLVRSHSGGLWEALVKRSSRLKYPPELIVTRKPEVKIRIHEGPLVEFPFENRAELWAFLNEVGEMPLPPYIEKREAKRDQDRYQASWARFDKIGSVAAPTASLHFTPELTEKMSQEGAGFVDLVLHVGLGTFQPLRSSDIANEELHFEEVEVSRENLGKISSHRGPRVCIGSTAMRTLESLSLSEDKSWRMECFVNNKESAVLGRTQLFVRPGFEFRYTDALMTNFHLPNSSLFVMLSCFCNSRRLAQEAYRYAISKRYRFFSYGDATLWI